jgi:hypothetical protein
MILLALSSHLEPGASSGGLASARVRIPENMARKSRFDSGGYAYGEMPGPAPGQTHRDAPLSPRGRLVWWLVLAALLIGTSALVLITVVSN